MDTGRLLGRVSLYVFLLGVAVAQADDLAPIGGGGTRLPLFDPSHSATPTEKVIQPPPNPSRSSTSPEEVIRPAVIPSRVPISPEEVIRPAVTPARVPTATEKVIRPASNLPSFATSPEQIIDGLTQPPAQPPSVKEPEPIKVKVIQSTPDGGGRETTVSVPVNGAAVKLRIEFAVNSSVIRKEAHPQLADLGRALTSARLANAAVTISGHTDSDGTETHNKWLSFRRAEAIKVYLVAHYSIDPKRLQVRGFGFSLPLVPNANAANKQINRRVEVELWPAERPVGK